MKKIAKLSKPQNYYIKNKLKKKTLLPMDD